MNYKRGDRKVCFAPGGESSRGCAGVWIRWQFFTQRSAGLPRYGGHLLPSQGVCKPTLSFANSSVGVLCKGRCPWKEGDTPPGGCHVLGHRGMRQCCCLSRDQGFSAQEPSPSGCTRNRLLRISHKYCAAILLSRLSPGHLKLSQVWV